jgi:RNA polymerase sigma factor, sigma-70 family
MNKDTAPQNLTESDLITDILRGESDLYAYFVSKYKNRVYTCAYRIVRNHHTAEDIAQDVFISAYVNLSKLTDKSKFLPWILSAVRNKSLNYLTRSPHISDSELDDLFTHESLAQETGESPEDVVLARERRHMIAAAFMKLPDKIRPTAVMYFLEKYPAKQICAMLGISENLARSRIHDAREYLKKELAHMNINTQKQGLSKGFDKKIQDEVTALRNYYHLNNFSYDGYDDVFSSLMKKVDSLPESAEKQHITASVLAANYWANSGKGDIDQTLSAAKLGQNADALSFAFIAKWAAVGDKDYAEYYDEAYPLIKQIPDSENALGELNFWKALILLRNDDDYETAGEIFKTAMSQMKKDNIICTAAAAGLRMTELIKENKDEIDFTARNILVFGERYWNRDGKMMFVCQPGGGDNRGLDQKHFSHAYPLHFSAVGMTLIDDSMNVGDARAGTGGTGYSKVISKTARVTVAAGSFKNCLKLKNQPQKEEAWYAPNVGLVCAEFGKGTQAHQRYELVEYAVSDANAGSPYLPLCEGNYWRYRNANLPSDEYGQFLEYRITYISGEYADFAVTLCSFRKK